MNIIKLVSVILLLGVTACGSSEKEAEIIIDEEPKVVKEDKSAVLCSDISCEEDNKFIIKQVYADVINGLNTGLTASLYSETFIQHNASITAGVEGQEAYFVDLTTRLPNHIATIKHIIADGDYVAVHWHYSDDVENEFVGSAMVDLYKLADGMISEHWNVSMTPNVSTASGNSVFSDLYIYPENTLPNNNADIEDENNVMVTAFYLDLFNNQNLNLISELVDSSYLQHNYWVPNGSYALESFVSGGGTGGLSIFLTLAEKDMVWTFSGSGAANLETVDLWRVDNNINKIVEHWDVF
ncbi:ester cyclase [Colwellia psychrerythraea]|uniref:SnoaL-like domain-containing protein n=1 Tax=Colwellia psychrerythraea TaxID=28229 RepID=A0A099K907_COLPS|nr:ester cyclase [Colwellia psychrerythraea]KGJ86851.1 protein of unknown function DUF1486 [Colwellia psychrerythraea]